MAAGRGRAHKRYWRRVSDNRDLRRAVALSLDRKAFIVGREEELDLLLRRWHQAICCARAASRLGLGGRGQGCLHRESIIAVSRRVNRLVQRHISSEDER
jgi:hypothetical protein